MDRRSNFTDKHGWRSAIPFLSSVYIRVIRGLNSWGCGCFDHGFHGLARMALRDSLSLIRVIRVIRGFEFLGLWLF